MKDALFANLDLMKTNLEDLQSRLRALGGINSMLVGSCKELAGALDAIVQCMEKKGTACWLCEQVTRCYKFSMFFVTAVQVAREGENVNDLLRLLFDDIRDKAALIKAAISVSEENLQEPPQMHDN